MTLPKNPNVLSLFDGISCANVALKKLNIQPANYFASEIDKFAIKCAQANHSEIIQLGNVEGVGKELLSEYNIDLLIGGSPCQSFSFAGKQLNFDDPRGKLFFQFVRILKEIKPTYFLLENVKMKKEYENIISYHLGVEAIEINSNLLSAQTRKRLYWTNIPNVKQPKDKNIKLTDILEPREKFNNSINLNRCGRRARRFDENGVQKSSKNFPLYKFYEVTDVNKMHTITKNERESMVTPLPAGKYEINEENKKLLSTLTPTECEKLQTLPEGYTSNLSKSKRRDKLGDAFTVDVISHILSNVKLSN
mgnify:CR=1 FL=1